MYSLQYLQVAAECVGMIHEVVNHHLSGEGIEITLVNVFLTTVETYAAGCKD